MLRRLWDGRHWFAIIPVWRGTEDAGQDKHEDVAYYFNMDSKLDQPLCLGPLDALLVYLKRVIIEEQAQIFLITPDTDEDSAD